MEGMLQSGGTKMVPLNWKMRLQLGHFRPIPLNKRQEKKVIILLTGEMYPITKGKLGYKNEKNDYFCNTGDSLGFSVLPSTVVKVMKVSGKS